MAYTGLGLVGFNRHCKVCMHDDNQGEFPEMQGSYCCFFAYRQTQTQQQAAAREKPLHRVRLRLLVPVDSRPRQSLNQVCPLHTHSRRSFLQQAAVCSHACILTYKEFLKPMWCCSWQSQGPQLTLDGQISMQES
jgi:hypothetical protein